MADQSNRSPSAAAERAFAQYVARVGAGEELGFEDFCRQHEALRDELVRLRAEWTDATVSVRIGRIVGKDVDARVALDGGDDPRAQEQAEEARIGRYRLGAEVARGGQGAILRVFDRDLRRHLAMKVVLGESERGIDAPVASVAPKTLGRFLEEAQVTAQLDHPGIVPVHELGLDPRGRAYFTMKLVKGVDLGVVYDQTKTGADGWNRTRALGVLVKVCEAMSFAHHKGVIHRDLKPANVMVGHFGEVYVMDWGLARVLAEPAERHDGNAPDALQLEPDLEDGDESLVTMVGDVVGTPTYMPPEQALGNISAMGPHSDVYSVGAMLYELLAGHPPFDPVGARLGLFELLQKVQHEAPRPLAKAARDVPPELAAICEKAMDRDPARRYPDMSGLAEDLRAFLEGRVVRAFETGAVAELRKWVSRNRALACAMAAGVLALVAGLATTRVQKGRADRNAALAQQGEEAAQRAEAKATAEAERASREAETARRTADFLVGLFEVVDPGEARGNTITAREILDRGAQRIDTELGDQPEIQSALMDTMGTVYQSLGLYDRALPLLERSRARRAETYGPEHLLTAETLNGIGRLRRLKAEYAEAERDLRAALEIRRAQLGPEHEAVAESLHELGVVLTDSGRFAEAEGLFREALAVRRARLGRHPDVAETLSALAFNLFDQGKREAGEPLLRESLEIRQEVLGEHPDTAESLNDLGVYLFEREEFGPAEEMLRAALEMKRRLYTDVHPEVALGLNNLAVAYHERNQLDEAEKLYTEALAIQRQLLGPAHPDIAQAMQNVALLRKDRGDWDGAKELLLGAVAMYREVQGDAHPNTQRALKNAIQFLRDRTRARWPEGGERSREYALALVERADLLVLAGSHGEAHDAGLEALEVLGADPAAEPWQTALAESVLGAALTGQGSFEEAEGLLLGAFDTLQAARGPGSPEAQQAVQRLVGLHERWRPAEADRFRALLTPPPAPR